MGALTEISKLDTRAPLDRSPGKNWVENSGGLPMYIRRIANHLHAKGMSIGHAIATAVNAVKKMCSTGDINFPGKQQVNAGSQAEACAAVASWERKKAGARVSKGVLGRKWSDDEFIDFLVNEAEIHKAMDCGCEHGESSRRKKKKIKKDFNPNQPRDREGKWTDTPGVSRALPSRDMTVRNSRRGNSVKEALVGAQLQISSRVFVKHGPDAWAEDWMGPNPAKTRKDSSIMAELSKAKKNGLSIRWKAQVSKKKKSNPEADAETAKINENKKTWAGKQHKFKAADWTHPNGHPRCIRCGDEEPVGGICKRLPLEISDEEFDELVEKINTDPSMATVTFDATGEIEKRDDDKRLVFGWASIAIHKDGTVEVDKQGDVLEDIDQMEKVAYDFVLHSRDGGEMHVRKGVSTMVESFVSTDEKWEAMGIPEGTLPVGWWVGFRVNDDKVWEDVKKKKYRMFSVHGSGTRKALD